jgi:hypothetical protein
MYVKAIIIISVIVILFVIYLLCRKSPNGSGIQKITRTTDELGKNNSRRQSNDIGINNDIESIEEKAGDLRRNNGTRSDIDRETREILEGATYRNNTDKDI